MIHKVSKYSWLAMNIIANINFKQISIKEDTNFSPFLLIRKYEITLNN